MDISPLAPSYPIPVRITPIAFSPTSFATDSKRISTDGQWPFSFLPSKQLTLYLPPTFIIFICLSPGAISTCPSFIKSPVCASFTHKPTVSLSLSANMRENTGGICCTITIPGMLSGKALIIVLIASVPPVEAPIAIILFLLYCLEPYILLLIDSLLLCLIFAT